MGSALVLDQEGEAELIPALLQLKAKCDGLHAQAFERAELFGYALREAFEAVLNARPNRPAELLAKFLDAQLRAGAKGGGGGGAGEDELEGTLDRAMGLFRFLGGKDMFEAFHRKELAKRLLLGKAASLDAEKGLVSKLKAQCGAGFTNKLEGMFRDMELSAELNAAFEQRPRAAGGGSNGAGGADGELSVCVLTTGFWPHYPPVALELPAELGRLQEAFGAFYLSRHSGRRLSWVPSLSHCVVRAAFAARPHELQLSLLQAAVCLLFNSADNLSLEQIQEGTGIGARGRRRAQRLRARAAALTPPPPGSAPCARRSARAQADAAVAGVRQGARAEQGAQGPRGRGRRRLLLPRRPAAPPLPDQGQLDTEPRERAGARGHGGQGLRRQAVSGTRTRAARGGRAGAAARSARDLRRLRLRPARLPLRRSTPRSCAR